jgi:hypothetical protein
VVADPLSSWSASDPSTWAQLFSQYAAPGGALTTDESTLIADEYSAALERRRENANPYGGGYMSGLSGFRFPAWVSPDELHRVLGEAEQWAGTVGWQYMPTAQEIVGLMGQGAMTAQDVGSYFFSRLPSNVQASIPWAQYGLTKDNYVGQLRQYNETAFGLFGTDFSQSGLDQSMLQTALNNNWSTGRWSEALSLDPTARSKYGWIRHGMDYQGFQKYVTDNKSTLEKRYGMGQATSSNALSDLDNPLVGFGSYAGAISFDSQKSPLMSTSQSSVR